MGQTEKNDVPVSTENALPLYEDIVKNSPAGLIVLRLEDMENENTLRFVLANPACEQMTGVPFRHFEGKLAVEVLPALENTEILSILARVIRTGRTVNLGEIRYGDAEIKEGFYSTKAFPLPDRCIGIVFENVTERRRSDERLRRSEMQLAQAQRIARMGSWEWDLTTGGISLSEESGRIYGVNPKEFESTYAAFLNLVHPEDREFVDQTFQHAVQEKHSFRIEHRIQHSEGKTNVVLVQGQLIHDEDEKPIVVIGTAHDITERKHADELLKRSREQLRALSGHLQSVREEERAKVAREVHDELGQVLTALKMELSLLSYKLMESSSVIPRAQLFDEIGSMTRMVDTTIQVVRRIVTELRPEVLDYLGLKAAIEWQAQEFQTRTGIKCVLRSKIKDIEISERDSETAIFRILQETLTNVARHANATRVDIRLEEKDASMVLEVKDNGRGILEQDMANTRSFGLLGIQERASLLGGEVDIHGEPQKGTTVTLKIPVRALKRLQEQNKS